MKDYSREIEAILGNFNSQVELDDVLWYLGAGGTISDMLNKTDVSLVDIEEHICGIWFPEVPDDDPKWEEKVDKQLSEFYIFASMVIEILIEDLLDVNEENFRKIYDYARSENGTYSYYVYNRLISDFDGFLLPEEKQELVEVAKARFKNEKTDHWI
jgi:hypothetical protein